MIDAHPYCPFCNSESVLYWQGVNVWRCPECQLLFKHPSPSTEELDQLYQKSWFKPETHVAQVGATDLNLARQYVGRLTQTLGVDVLKGANILEFGSGSGAMLTALSEAGAAVWGVEPYGYDLLVAQGHRVYRRIEDLPPKMRFDGIVSLEVIEHLVNPWQELAQLQKILQDSGWLLLTTPNPRGLNARLSRAKWREARKPGHLMFFPPYTMEAILAKAGFSACQRQRWFIRYYGNTIKGFLQWLLQLAHLDGSLRYLAWK